MQGQGEGNLKIEDHLQVIGNDRCKGKGGNHKIKDNLEVMDEDTIQLG